MSRTHSRRTVLTASGAALLGTLVTPHAMGQPRSGGSAPATLVTAFEQAARAHDVPADLLAAVADTLTGSRSVSTPWGGIGTMQLIERPDLKILPKAASAGGHSAGEVREDLAANVDAGAAWLRTLADRFGLSAPDRGRLAAWHGPLELYSGIKDAAVARREADMVFARLARATGEVVPEVTKALAVQPLAAEYPGSHWVSASTSNYRVGSRGAADIDRVVIHTTQGAYAGAISWFQNPTAQVSAHYVIRSADGDITQMVEHKDVAWHVGNTNDRSIGIEHEGWVDDASWYTEEMYAASAALTSWLCDTLQIPKDRTHVIAHSEAPGATHTDPGPNWDWDHYMDLVNGSTPPTDGWNVVVDNADEEFTASSNWEDGNADGQHGADHVHAQPTPSSDVAWFAAEVPADGVYKVEAWYPQDPSNNSRAPYIVAATGGNQTVYVDQRAGGGRWNSLGQFELAAGGGNKVGVSRWTGTEGWIEADAVRISET
ncbi:MAG: golvesin C-terminal-like domain-containing protein [Propionibacteriaceae bacterium]